MNIYTNTFFDKIFSKIHSKTHQIAPFKKKLGKQAPKPPSKRCLCKYPHFSKIKFNPPPPRKEILDTPLAPLAKFTLGGSYLFMKCDVIIHEK